MRVLAIGECMAELAPSATAGDYHLGFAGDTFNTAWYLARVAPDFTVSYFTVVGDDRLSGQMRAVMVDAGIDTTFVTERADSTVGLYLISLDGGERSFSYWRGQAAARHLADDPAALAQAMAMADVVYVSGITLAILSPAARKTLIAAMRDARAAGKIVAFDPNLRPKLWEDAQALSQTVMLAATACDIALPSFEDEATWFGDAAPMDTAARYADAGAQTVIVKNGDGAVSYLHAGDMGTVSPPVAVKVVDSTAAGDSFNAGILAGLAGHAPLPDTIARACALAARVVQGRGALVPVDPHLPSLSDA